MTVTFGNVLEKSYVIDQACIKYIVAARTNVTLFNNVVIKKLWVYNIKIDNFNGFLLYIKHGTKNGTDLKTEFFNSNMMLFSLLDLYLC